MKKKIAIICALVLVVVSLLTVFAACNKDKLTDDNLKALRSTLIEMYKNDAKVQNANYKVMGEVTGYDADGKEIKAAIAWTIEGTDKVTVSKDKDENGNYTIQVPDRSTLTSDLSYKLTGTLVNAKGNAYENEAGEKYTATFDREVVTYAILTFNADSKITAYGDALKDDYGNDGWSSVTWEEDGITLVNKRGESKNAANKYVSPARFYAKTTLEISYGTAFKAIRITLNSATSNAGGFDGMNVTGATIKRVEKTVLITFATATTKFETAPLSAQTRIDKLEVFTAYVPELETDPEPAHETGKSVADLATTPPTDNLKLIYEVEGVWVADGDADDKEGHGLLYDPSTGKSLIIYGMADTSAALAWSGSNYGFTNPKKFQDIKSQFEDGDVLKLGIAYSTQYSNYYAYFIARTEVKANVDYTATVTCNPTEGGTAELSKSAQLHYGDEVTVTPNPASGYQVAEVKLNGKTVTEDEGAYKFNVVPGPNAVTVTFEEAGKAHAALTLARDTIFNGITGNGYANYNKTHNYGGYAITTQDVMGSTYGSPSITVLQFKAGSNTASGGTLTFTGTFSKIVIVQLSTYDYDGTNKLKVTVGGNEITPTQVGDGEATGSTYTNTSNNKTYDITKFTMEYTITGSGAQEIKLESASAGAKYITVIEFYA